MDRLDKGIFFFLKEKYSENFYTHDEQMIYVLNLYFFIIFHFFFIISSIFSFCMKSLIQIMNFMIYQTAQIACY